MRGSEISYHLRHITSSREVQASLLLFIAAAISFALPIVIALEEMITSILLLCGFACFMIGVIVLTFHRWDLVLPDVAGMLAPGGQIALEKIAQSLGASGGAWIIPGEPPVQFIPVQNLVHSGYIHWNGTTGLAFPPLSQPIWALLQTKYKLVRANSPETAIASFIESVRYALELADRVEGRMENDLCIIEIRRYKLYEGCALVRKTSPDCCMMAPCGVCGLAGLILADGTNAAWGFDLIQLTPETHSIRIELREITRE